MADLQWSAEGRTDVDDVYDYIARRDRRPATADKVVRGLAATCQWLAEEFATGSVVGTARPDLDEDFRVFTHQRWVIVFHPIANGIKVVRVLDGSRDFSRIFGD
jgi:plasmid stabilization system protein ParE